MFGHRDTQRTFAVQIGQGAVAVMFDEILPDRLSRLPAGLFLVGPGETEQSFRDQCVSRLLRLSAEKDTVRLGCRSGTLRLLVPLGQVPERWRDDARIRKLADKATEDR